MNYNGLCDAKFTWYSLNKLPSMVWSRVSEIHTFRSTWPCLIIKVVAAQIKFPQPSADCTAISCAFTFYTANVFGCFWGVIDQFKLVKHNFLKSTLSDVDLYSFQTSEAMHCMSEHQLPRYYQPKQVPPTAWTASVTS